MYTNSHQNSNNFIPHHVLQGSIEHTMAAIPYYNGLRERMVMEGRLGRIQQEANAVRQNAAQAKYECAIRDRAKTVELDGMKMRIESLETSNATLIQRNTALEQAYNSLNARNQSLLLEKKENLQKWKAERQSILGARHIDLQCGAMHDLAVRMGQAERERDEILAVLEKKTKREAKLDAQLAKCEPYYHAAEGEPKRGSHHRQFQAKLRWAFCLLFAIFVMTTFYDKYPELAKAIAWCLYVFLSTEITSMLEIFSKFAVIGCIAFFIIATRRLYLKVMSLLIDKSDLSQEAPVEPGISNIPSRFGSGGSPYTQVTNVRKYHKLEEEAHRIQQNSRTAHVADTDTRAAQNTPAAIFGHRWFGEMNHI